MELDDSLVSWINTFDGLSRECSTLADLSDGVILSEILADIDPSKASLPVKSGSLMREFAKNLESFYQYVLGLSPDLSEIDLDAASKGDAKEIFKLVELTLGCAVQCDDKQRYIENIMTLSPEHQAQLMILIKGIIDKTSSVLASCRSFRLPSLASAEQDDQSDNAFSPRKAEEVEHLTQEIEHLAAEVKSAKSALASVTQEHQTSIAKMAEERAEWNKLLASQKAEIDRVKKSSAEYESQCQDYKAELLDKDRIITDLKRKVAESAKSAQETRSLRDEIDILKAKLAQAAKDEAALQKYKKLAQEAADLKKQLKLSEDQNSVYLEKTLDLEEQLKKIPVIKAQVESYRNQAASLESRSSELQVQLQRKEFEVLKLNDNLKAVSADKDRLLAEMEALKETLARDRSGADMLSPVGPGIGLDMLSSDSMERIARLERENKFLKSSSQDQERLELLQNQLDDSNRLKAKFEKDYLGEHQKNLQLESQVEMLTRRVREMEAELAVKARVTPSAPTALSVTELHAQVAALERERQGLRDDLQQSQSEKASSSSKDKDTIASLRKEVEKLQALVDKQIEDIEHLVDERNMLKDENRRHLEDLATVLMEKDKLSQQYLSVKDLLSTQERTVAEHQVALQHKSNEVRRIVEENQSLTKIAKASGEQLASLHEELAKKDQRIAQLHSQHNPKEEANLRSQIRDLEEKIKKYSTEVTNLVAEKQRYTEYSKQARQVIINQQEGHKQKLKEQREIDAASHKEEMQGVQTLLKIKDQEIEALKESRERVKEQMRMENRMVTTAFYEMGLDLIKLSAMAPRATGPLPTTSPLGRLRSQLT